jgi:hypothetical protein
MPAEKQKPLTLEEQRALFIEGAKQSGANETGKAIEKAFKKIGICRFLKKNASLGVAYPAPPVWGRQV